MSLPVAHQRCQKIDASALVLGDNHGDDFLLGIFYHFLAAFIGYSFADAGEKQAEEIIDFCNGADCGAWVLVGGLLVYADDGAETRYLVYFGTLNIIKKISGVSRESLNVSALPFGI